MRRRQKKPDLLLGTLDLLLLQTLARAPQHGYGIASHIQRVTDDVLRVEEGSMYPALHRMEQAGWVKAEWQQTSYGRRARVYALTALGRQRLRDEQNKWQRLSEGVGKLLRFA